MRAHFANSDPKEDQLNIALRKSKNPMRLFAIINLALLPVIWLAPLFGTGLLPFFGLHQVSILSGLTALISKDLALAAIIFLFVILMPLAKALAMLNHAYGGKFPSKRVTYWLARLSMLDIFLIALSIVVIKGVGIGRVEILWGFWLFAFYIFAGFLLAAVKRQP